MMDCINRLFSHSVFFRKTRRKFSVCATLSDFYYLCIIELGVIVNATWTSFWMKSAAHFITLSLSSFGISIGSIIRSCSKKEVCWVHARRIIAFVENTKSVRDFLKAKSPRQSVCLNRFTSKPENTISAAVKAGGPHPTLSKVRSVQWNWTVTIYLLEKSFLDGLKVLEVIIDCPLGWGDACLRFVHKSLYVSSLANAVRYNRSAFALGKTTIADEWAS